MMKSVYTLTTLRIVLSLYAVSDLCIPIDNHHEQGKKKKANIKTRQQVRITNWQRNQCQFDRYDDVILAII